MWWRSTEHRGRGTSPSPWAPFLPGGTGALLERTFSCPHPTVGVGRAAVSCCFISSKSSSPAYNIFPTGPPGKYQDFYKYLLLFLAVSFFPLIISFTFSKNVLSVSFLWQFFCHLNSMVINPMVSSVTHLSRSVRNTWFDSFLLPWNPFFSWFLWPPTSTDFHSSSMVNILILSSCGSFPSFNF